MLRPRSGGLAPAAHRPDARGFADCAASQRRAAPAAHRPDARGFAARSFLRSCFSIPGGGGDFTRPLAAADRGGFPAPRPIDERTTGHQDKRSCPARRKGRGPRDQVAPPAEGDRGRAVRPPRAPKASGARPVVLSSFRPVVERAGLRNPGARAAQARRIRQWRIRNRRCEADGVASALRHVSAFSRTRRSGRTRRCSPRFAKRAVRGQRAVASATGRVLLCSK